MAGSGSNFPQKLGTERLILRLFEPSDARLVDDYLGVYNDPTFVSAIGDRGLRTAKDVEKHLEGHRLGPDYSAARKKPSHILVYLGYERETDKNVGLVSILHRDNLVPPDLGWATVTPFAGRGYATEMAKELLQFWCNDYVATTNRSIWAAITRGNRRSAAVAIKIGFVNLGAVHGGSLEQWSRPGTMKIDSDVLWEAKGTVDKKWALL